MLVYTSYFTILLADGMDNLLTGSVVNPPIFKSLYPIHVFDVTRVND